MPFTRPCTPDEAWERLIAGNRRYVAEQPMAPVLAARRAELAAGQQPFAVIVGCSDSRVPVETIFDQPPGNVFVIRLAGHVITDEALASIEYGVSVLGASLVLILGHSSCGAVKAAVDHVDQGAQFGGHLHTLIDEIAPAVRALDRQSERRCEDAVALHARRSAAAVSERSQTVNEAIAQQRVRVDAALYDLSSGLVWPLGR
jgi:carbonic anhydrase